MSKKLIKKLSGKIKLAKLGINVATNTVRIGKVAFAAFRIKRRHKSK